MNRVITLAVGMAVVAACASGCGSSSSTTSLTPHSSADATTASGGASPSAGSAATLKTASSPLGQILVDGSGKTLYLFKADTGTTSTCNGSCAQAWPPQSTTGKPSSGGVTASKVGTTTRSDHSTQVTYNGHPLYYFAEDTKPGETKGQGVNAFGALWYVVSPSGNAVTNSASTSASPSATSTGGGGGY